MPTWVSCLRAESRQSGFTLLEMLVVLFLMGVLAALVAPRLQRTYEAIASSGERAEVARNLEQLPFLAQEAGGLSFAPGDEAGAALLQLLALPEGWSVVPATALRVEANGFCHPATLRVAGAGTVEDWALSAPDCGVVDGP